MAPLVYGAILCFQSDYDIISPTQQMVILIFYGPSYELGIIVFDTHLHE